MNSTVNGINLENILEPAFKRGGEIIVPKRYFREIMSLANSYVRRNTWLDMVGCDFKLIFK